MCEEGKFSLGDVFTYKHNDQIIYNLGTQKTWRTKADIKAIETALTEMLRNADVNGIYKIALPKIGAGLGGLNWNDVKGVIDNVSQSYPNIELNVVENYKEN